MPIRKRPTRKYQEWCRLLVDVVQESGGTVRAPDNRIKLLEDWLTAAGG